MLGIKEQFLSKLVDQASNGQEALDIVKESLLLEQGYSYGIIFMDCSMPIMDGYTSSKEIRKFYHENRID